MKKQFHAIFFRIIYDLIDNPLDSIILNVCIKMEMPPKPNTKEESDNINFDEPSKDKLFIPLVTSKIPVNVDFI